MPVFLSKDATIEVSFLVSSSVLPSCILLASQVKMSGILHSAFPFFCGPGELWLCQSEARCWGEDYATTGSPLSWFWPILLILQAPGI
jgi:hypothetical protein